MARMKQRARMQRGMRCPECHSVDLLVAPDGWMTCVTCGHDCDSPPRETEHHDRFAEMYDFGDTLPVESL